MRIYALIFLVVSAGVCRAQSNYAPLNDDYYHLIDRYEIKSGVTTPYLFSGVKPYKRSAIVSFMDSVADLNVFLSPADLFNYTYLNNDSWEWSDDAENESERPILRHFYRKKSDFFHVSTPELDLHVNPVMYLSAGRESGGDDPMFMNTRGVEVRGMVDRKVGFYTYLTDNQMLLPTYVRERIDQTRVVPHEGFWKSYKEGEAVDFLQARGYITFEATKSINLQFGHDRFFIGHGHRSLIFSDFGPPSLFLKGNAKVWKLNYLFLLNQMTADNVIPGNGGRNGYPNKFVALHHLSMNIGKRLNVGIFESVVFSPDDTLGTNFRLEYLNPIIFYRAIEQQNGSSDNAMLGLDLRWLPIRGISVYGQFLLDEFVIDNIREGNGWWANKWAVQAGAEWIDVFGLPNFDIQAELNIARPYTYSHHTMYGNYTGYRQPIAHPLGANFREVVAIARYQPLPRLSLEAKAMLANIGRDTTGVNWGGDILKSYRTREREYGNTIGQGVSNDILLGTLTASWQLKHNLFVDGMFVMRRSESPAAAFQSSSTIAALALRWNIARRLYEF